MLKVISELYKKKEYYERVKHMVEKALENTTVTGNIRIVDNHGSDAYYLCTEKADTKGRYLRKHEVDIAKAIIQRDYEQKVLTCAETWIKWIDRTLNTMPQMTIPMVFEQSKRRKVLIHPYELPDIEYRKQWECIKYKGKEFKEGTPEIYTEKGERVRSKTEKMIADKLYLLDIPYRYEYPIRIIEKGRMVYPDFTLLNIKTRKEIIWEHFGMMDNPDYAENAVYKIQCYTRAGFYAGENIIFTFETSKTPIDMIGVQKILKSLRF